MSSIEKVGVIGGGTMGAGIAEVCARATCDVRVLEVSEEAVEAGRARLDSSLGRAVRTGRLGEAERDAVLARLEWTT
ncbi:MAG: 3-hydroxybutyryl-CoA dehydrogenase, partial [Frankiales bacterium]|nr:3-hydroxybutyryl-CoA dehydrogenase [Frankiales bacterium]